MHFIEIIKNDFPNFDFEISNQNLWLPNENKILFISDDKVGLLHEIGHAICKHNNFIQDIELLHAEREAWDKALQLSKKYKVKISQKRIESAMNWYRDWLHTRSSCPKCLQNGIQHRSDRCYECLNCGSIWATNDARNVNLKRYIQK